MSIAFKYTIINVDEAARCMEVVYEAQGHQTMHIGARLPFEGEALESVIQMFAPIPLWVEAMTPVVVPQVGASGVVTPQEEQYPAVTEEVQDPVFAAVFPTEASGAIGVTTFE